MDGWGVRGAGGVGGGGGREDGSLQCALYNSSTEIDLSMQHDYSKVKIALLSHQRN